MDKTSGIWVVIQIDTAHESQPGVVCGVFRTESEVLARRDELMAEQHGIGEFYYKARFLACLARPSAVDDAAEISYDLIGGKRV